MPEKPWSFTEHQNGVCWNKINNYLFILPTTSMCVVNNFVYKQGNGCGHAIEKRAEHYSDVIMGAMASQITSITIVYSTVYSDTDHKNIKAPRHWPLCGELTGEFPAQRASNAETVSIWWRHHGVSVDWWWENRYVGHISNGNCCEIHGLTMQFDFKSIHLDYKKFLCN